MLDREDARYTLCAARELIASKGRAKYVYELGNCFCTVGAIVKTKEPRASMDIYLGELSEDFRYSTLMTRRDIGPILDHFAKANSMPTTVDIFVKNDELETEGVLEMFDKAIAAL
ncbi:hypothetical protein PP935_gp165 [Rhizobium phage RHph_N34]|uniref:Uncharacterized protein n=1 Tax=Rhizobium phage RHph_N34 TaxID=2509586 RepID=A0A7S5RA64_9CAUD|nr:hypothetical protein PP935_gp165 [Rhizobium phage RHph_N34]QIG73940.1 hypothetical protein EVC06_165 [Rhizobium phage RHph_N34]